MLAHMLLDQFLHQAADRAAHGRHQLERLRTACVARQLPLDGGDLSGDPAHPRQQLVSIRNNVHRVPPYTIFGCAPRGGSWGDLS